MDEKPQPSMMPVAIAIVFAGALIAFSLYYVLRPAEPTSLIPDAERIQFREVTDADHILGNPAAPIKIIEYSDLDCQFCRIFHATMKQIMLEYGKTGEVAWVYRHFPIVELHPNAPRLAEASECVAELGGNDAFWKFIDTVFTTSNGGRFDMERLDATAATAGVTVTAFRECYDSRRHQAKVAADFDDATKAGGVGTPHNIIVSPVSPPIPVPGAQPYSTIQSIISTLLAGN
jgi:protein-disulfide isomerase